MATRFYCHGTAASPLNALAYAAGWEQTGEAVRRFAFRKGLPSSVSTMASQSITIPVTTTQQVLARQYCTEPLPYRVAIAGTLSMVMSVSQGANTFNCFLAYVLRIVSNDGGTIRGTLASSMTNAGTEYTTSQQTRIFSAAALTPLTAEAGDRLVMEIGSHLQAPTATGNAAHFWGYSNQADFALTSGLTTNLNTWWELSQNLWPGFSANHQIFRGADGASVTESWR